jgi:hypothetical protein
VDVTWLVDEGGLVSVIFVVVLLVLVAYPVDVPVFRTSKSWVETCKVVDANLDEADSLAGATTLLLLMATATETNEEEVRPIGDRPWLGEDMLV